MYFLCVLMGYFVSEVVSTYEGANICGFCVDSKNIASNLNAF